MRVMISLKGILWQATILLLHSIVHSLNCCTRRRAHNVLTCQSPCLLLTVCLLEHRTITLRKDRFEEREYDFYEALYTQSQAQFATYVSTGTVVNNYAHIFDLLIRLRQVFHSIVTGDRSETGHHSEA